MSRRSAPSAVNATSVPAHFSSRVNAALGLKLRPNSGGDQVSVEEDLPEVARIREQVVHIFPGGSSLLARPASGREPTKWGFLVLRIVYL